MKHFQKFHTFFSTETKRKNSFIQFLIKKLNDSLCLNPEVAMCTWLESVLQQDHRSSLLWSCYNTDSNSEHKELSTVILL